MEKKTLRELVDELERQKKNRYDIVVPSDQLKVDVDVGTNTIFMKIPSVDGKEGKQHGITNYAHGQIADKTGIPKRYYDKMMETGKLELLADNINTWLPDKEKRLVRVLDDDVRAILSDRYRLIDNYDVFFATLQELNKIKESRRVEIDTPRAELTDIKLYIKATSPQLTDEVHHFRGKTEPVHGGIIISNSEVGAGAFVVEPFIDILVCKNGLIREKAFKRVHIGREKSIGLVDWSDETLQLEDKALWSKIRDMIQATFNPDIFHSWVDEINHVAPLEIEKPVLAVDNVISQYKLPEKMKDDLLNQFAKESPTQWGLSMAVTRIAQDMPSYDKQIEMEKLGAKLLEEDAVKIVRKEAQ